MFNHPCHCLPLLALCCLVARADAAETNSLRPWNDYRAIMWVGDSVWKQPEKVPIFFQRLREMGINTSMVHGDGNPRPHLDHQFPYYVENMVNKGLCLKWNSNVRDWDKFVTGWTKTGRPASAFVRDYCLDDPQWRSWARDQMQRLVRKNMAHHPVAYDIRDELSTTISANPFDYDFNPITLASFREWLKTQYKDLAALNAQWETQFKSWDEVKPFTTDQIKNRMASGDALPRGNPDWQAVARIQFDPVQARKNPTRWNFSPWCDFRTYMDISLASALEDIRRASHAVDPRTPVGIEGTQMPSAWGGYDLWRLSQVLDWIEPYDIGNAREIFGSFMPGKTFMTTVFEKDTPHAMRRLWHLLLEGDKGCIIWWSEDCIDWKSPDYALTPKAKALAPVLKEMTSPLAQLFLRAKKEYDPIAIHYSQPSIQVNWLLESTVDGSTWHRRFSSYEADHNRMAKVRNAWVKAFQDLGYSPRFMASEEIEGSGLIRSATQVFVLPNPLALSDEEVDAIRVFSDGHKQQRIMFWDGSQGGFDKHGRLRASAAGKPVNPALLVSMAGGSPLSARASYYYDTMQQSGLFPHMAGDIADFAKARLKENGGSDWLDWIGSHCGTIKLPVTISGTRTNPTQTRIHRYALGSARLLAFERNIDYHMSEDLKQAGGNEALEKPVDLEAKLARSAHVYDLRTRKYLGHTDRITFRLDPWQPSLFALLPGATTEDRLMETLLAQAWAD